MPRRKALALHVRSWFQRSAAEIQIYRPLCSKLKQFRLLTILPGNFTDPVQCLLEAASLSQYTMPEYETISYAWGDSTIRGRVVVGEETMDVPYSSMAVLRRMRSELHTRVVWIDAICINQNDLAERSAQVALMGRIYKNGSGNLIFLGDDEGGHAESAAEVLAMSDFKIDAAMESLNHYEHEELVRTGWTPNCWDENTILDDSNSPTFDALYCLPWFRRLWVLQEVALARTNTCYWGSCTFPLKLALRIGCVLSKAQAFNGLRIPWAKDGVEAACDMFQHVVLESARIHDTSVLTFAGTIQACKKFDTSEPRDRVFAVWQLFHQSSARTTIPQLLVPDYQKAVADVYRDATRYILEYEGRTDILDAVHHDSAASLRCEYTSWTRIFDLPLDFDTTPIGFTSEHDAGHHKDEFVQTQFESVSDVSILRPLVCKLGPVRVTTHAMGFVYKEKIGDVKSLIGHVSTLAKEDPSVIARVLIADQLSAYNAQFHDRDQALEGYAQCLAYMDQFQKPPPHLEMLPVDVTANVKSAAVFYRLFSEAASFRRFCMTETGHICCGPKLMENNDILVIAGGSSYPWILRPSSTEYFFLGCAYVYGLMNGEVFDMEDVEWGYVNIR